MVRQLKSSLPLLSLLGLVNCSGETLVPDNTKTDVAKIVYAVRQHTTVDANGNATSIDVAGGMGQVMDYGRYNPGGRLEVLDLRNGKVENLISDLKQADVSSVDVSFDGTRVLFTMKTSPNDHYHVYWASVVPNDDGTFERHQLTFGEYDDINAIWADSSRVVFVTNQDYTPMGRRADEYNHARAVTQLGTVTLDGGDADRKLCSQNLSHTINLFSMSDGRVGFSRWEHLENVNDVKLFAMNPDCTQMVALGGQHGKPGNSLVQVTESTTRNVFIGVVTDRENTIQAGALFRYDARSAKDPLRIDEEKEMAKAFRVITPGVPTGMDPSPIGRYRSPTVLPDGRLLVSWSDGPVNDRNEFDLTAPDYGLYIYDQSTGTNQLVKNYEDTWEVYARAVVARDEPAIVPSRQDNQDGSVAAVIGSINVADTSLTSRHGETLSGAQFDGATMDAALSEAVRVRIIEGFSSEAAPGATMFGLTMAEGAAILGEARVNADGSWMAEVPPYVPMHLQPIDRYDLAIRSQTTWIQGMPGESRVCGGCHEDRTSAVRATDQQLTIAAGKDPERYNLPITERTEYPWAYANDAGNVNEIQGILNARCVQCHNTTTNGDKPQEFYTVTMTDTVEGEMEETYMIPRLDLSDTPIAVTYDGEVATYPSSYVSLFYPAALAMEMGDGAMVEGVIPPRWAVPSDARHSKLIEKLNITSEADPADYAWTLGTVIEPDENGGTVAGGVHEDHIKTYVPEMTRDEVVKLIRAIDMGGQFYARQNTNFQPFTSDPVGGGTQY
jgi:hypothetical protein